MIGRYYFGLRYHHGYLDATPSPTPARLGAQDRTPWSHPAMLVSPNNDRVVTGIPFNAVVTMRYVPWSDEYVFFHRTRDLRTDHESDSSRCIRIYRMTPLGATTRTCIDGHFDFGNDNDFGVTTTRAGLLLWRNKHSANRGRLVSFDDRSTATMLVNDGLTGSVAVASDGCRIAFSSGEAFNNHRYGQRSKYYLKRTRVC